MRASQIACSEALRPGPPPGSPARAVADSVHGVVDSLLHPCAVLIRQVLTRSGRGELHLILIDDEENILQALHAGVELHSLYHSGAGSVSQALLQELPAGVRTFETTPRTSKKLFGNEKRSRVFALAHTPAPLSLEQIRAIRRDLVVLEELSISGNAGAIIRTSLALGAGAVILLNAQPVDLYDRRLIRASRGHIFSLPVLTATTEEFIRWCGEGALDILVMDARGLVPAHEMARLPRPLAFVFGNEKDGCSEALRRAARSRVQIPLDPRVESLNVSTAAGIVLHGRAWFNIPRVGR